VTTTPARVRHEYVNTILRREVDRRQRLDALAKLLDRLEQERGPVDQDRVAKYRYLLR